MDIRYDLRVIRAVMIKDLASSLRSRAFTILSVVLPLNFLIMFILFVLSGGQAPTAIVLQEHGPYARQFVSAMEHAHSFILQETTAQDAQRMLTEGKIVAIVTVPSTFDADLNAGRHVTLPVTVNNLEADFTNDIRRAVPLAITSFYSEAFPQQVVIQTREVDTHAHDTNYVQYLSVSILVIGLMLGGLLQGGSIASREYEQQTIKELLLSPASRWAIETGKALSALILNTASAAVVLAVVILLMQVVPVHWGEAIGSSLLIMTIFVAFGVLIGTLVHSVQALIPLSLGLSMPLFFISGAFAPVSFSTPLAAAFARALPVYYAIGVLQHAFHGYDTTETSLLANALILVGFALLAIVLSAITLRRERIAH